MIQAASDSFVSVFVVVVVFIYQIPRPAEREICHYNSINGRFLNYFWSNKLLFSLHVSHLHIGADFMVNGALHCFSSMRHKVEKE